MSDNNIIPFPGFLVLGDRNRVAKGCVVYPNFRATVLALPLHERERSYGGTAEVEGCGPAENRHRGRGSKKVWDVCPWDRAGMFPCVFRSFFVSDFCFLADLGSYKRWA